MYDAGVARYEIKSRRGVVRETAAVYGEPEPHVPTPVFQLTVGERGRLVLPAEVREKLKIKDGDRIALVLEKDGTMALKTRDVAIRSLRGMFKHLAVPGKLASDELIAERRREAKMEDREFRERTALHRRMKRAVGKRS
jgi:AbrB family looped-hinge helix DNA binding protein